MSFQDCNRILQLRCYETCCTLQVLQSTVEVAVLSACICSVLTVELAGGDGTFWFACPTLFSSIMRWLTALIGLFCLAPRGNEVDMSGLTIKPKGTHVALGITWGLCSLVTLSFVLLAYPRWAAFDQLHDTWRPWMKGLAFSNISLWLLCIMVMLPFRAPRLEDCPEVRADEWSDVVRPGLRRSHDVIMPSYCPEVRVDVDTLLADLTLRQFTVGTPGDTDAFGECVICLSGKYCEGDVVSELHCHHKFHSSCFAFWISKGGRACTMRCAPSRSLAQPTQFGLTTV